MEKLRSLTSMLQFTVVAREGAAGTNMDMRDLLRNSLTVVLDVVLDYPPFSSGKRLLSACDVAPM